MIFTSYKDKLFYLDLIFHILFTFLVLTLLFIIRFRKTKQQDITSKFKSVLNDTNILSPISNPTATDKENLKILDNIYKNRDNNDKVENKDIIKASYNQIIVLTIPVVIFVYFLVDKNSAVKLFIDKIITFSTLGCVLYLYSYYVRERYTEISKSEIFDIMNDANNDLTVTVTY